MAGRFVVEDEAPAQGRFVVEEAAPQTAVTRAYKSVAGPVTKAVSRVLDVATEPLVAWERASMGEPAAQIAKSYTGAGIEDMDRRSAERVNPLAEIIVPQTPLEAGAMVGTLGAGGIAAKAGLKPGMAALTRILGGTAGGAGGGYAGGEGAGTGALIGGGGAAAGEVLGVALPWLRSHGAGGRAAVNKDDTARIGQRLPSALGKPKTAEEMWEAAVTAPKRLGAAKETGVRELEEMLPGGVPSRYKTQPEPPPGVDPGEWLAEMGIRGQRSQFAQALGPAQIDVPSLGQSMTLREANELLSTRGDVLRGARPLDPRFKFADPKEAYAALARDIEQGIAEHGGAEALAKWRTIQDAYKVGRAEIKPFQRGAAYLPGQQAGDAQLNMVQVAKWLREPNNAAALIDKIGRPRYDQLVNDVTRGAGPLSTDVMESGRGGMTDALMSWLRGNNTGATQAIRLPLSTAVPGVGRQYAGRQPYTLPASLQAILDVALQKAGAAGLARE
jgi:hypothetical protein